MILIQCSEESIFLGLQSAHHILLDLKIKYCERRCLAALNKSHKIQRNEIERIRGIVLKVYTCDIDIFSCSEPSSNKL